MNPERLSAWKSTGAFSGSWVAGGPFTLRVHAEGCACLPLVIANPFCVRVVLEVDDGIFSFLAEPLQLAGSVPGGYHIGGLGGLAVSWRGSGGIYR